MRHETEAILLLRHAVLLGMLAYVLNPRICRAEAELLVQDQPDLQSKFQVSQLYTVSSCLKQRSQKMHSLNK